jgi:hypothetical protein
MKYEAKLIQVTPEMAKKMLANNGKNWRTINSSEVTRLVQAIKANQHRCDGSLVRFNAKGDLLNGQYLLSAVIYANTAAWAWVAGWQ